MRNAGVCKGVFMQQPQYS